MGVSFMKAMSSKSTETTTEIVVSSAESVVFNCSKSAVVSAESAMVSTEAFDSVSYVSVAPSVVANTVIMVCHVLVMCHVMSLVESAMTNCVG